MELDHNDQLENMRKTVCQMANRLSFEQLIVSGINQLPAQKIRLSKGLTDKLMAMLSGRIFSGRPSG